MKKIILGLLLGFVAGIINIFPMYFQNLELTVLISNLFIWILVGFFISIVKFNMPAYLKGSLIAVLISSPSMVYIIFSSVIGLIWTLLWTIITGALLGIVQNKIKD